MTDKKIIGYRIESNDDQHITPSELPTYGVFSKRIVDYWMDACTEKDKWNIVNIYEGDIENPVYIS